MAEAEGGRKTTPQTSPSAIDAVLKSGREIRNKVIQEWNKGPSRNYALLNKLLDEAKMLLTQITSYSPLPENETMVQKLTVARELLELGARVSVAKMLNDANNSCEEFDRYIAQLKHYYFDLRYLEQSQYMHEILGMNLLKLLSQNRIAEFHTELELFVHSDVNNVLNNIYIKKAVEIQQYLTEGRYNKIVALHSASNSDLKKEGIQSSGFRYFIDRVIENSRNVIAEVIESSYDRLDFHFARKSLHAEQTMLEKIAKERNWTMDQGYVYFPKEGLEDDALRASNLVIDALQYAKELDTIV